MRTRSLHCDFFFLKKIYIYYLHSVWNVGTFNFVFLINLPEKKLHGASGPLLIQEKQKILNPELPLKYFPLLLVL